MSLVGCESRYINRKGYIDKKARKWILEPLPESPGNIYLWWTYKKHQCKDGSVAYYKYLNFSKGGVKETFYCHGGKHYPDTFMTAHMHDFMYVFSMFCGNIDNFRHPPKYKKLKRRNGRPKVFDTHLYELLDCAGFGTIGIEIVVKYKKFLTLEAAAFRFSLLTEHDRQVVGSPGNLLDLCKRGYSLLKRRNRLSISTTYEQCFHDTAVEELGL